MNRDALTRAGRTALRGAGSLPDPGRRRSFGREVVFHAAKRFTPTLTVDRDGLRLQVSTSDNGVGKTLFIGSDVDGEAFDAAIGLLEERGHAVAGRAFVDIGANIGTTTLRALLRHGFSASTSFEPEPGNLTLLRQNAIANGVADRVAIVAAALSDSEGSVEFEVSPGNPSDSRVRRGGGSGPELQGESGWATHTVQTVTFDSKVDDGAIDLGASGLVWIDAQGHETHILTGASSLRGAGIPVVIEYWPYGLGRSGGLADLAQVAGAMFGSFVDLGETAFEERPASALEGFEKRYPGTAHTDLLLLP